MRPIRLALAGAAVFVASGVATPDANAQLTTIDFTNLIQNTATALNTAQQVKQGYDMVVNTAKQVEYQLENLKRVDPTSFYGVVNAYNQGLMTYATYQGTKDSMGYQAASVRQSFESLFPNLARSKAMHPNDYYGSHGERQAAMQAAAYTAATAQANEQQLLENQQLAKKIAVKSQSAPGEVAQIQLVIESLIVVQKQLDTLTKMMSASERVNALGAAEAASNSMIATEMSRRALAGYKTRGAAPRPAKPR
jgi:P-type conjugative transfer protein TrbJ